MRAARGFSVFTEVQPQGRGGQSTCPPPALSAPLCGPQKHMQQQRIACTPKSQVVRLSVLVLRSAVRPEARAPDTAAVGAMQRAWLPLAWAAALGALAGATLAGRRGGGGSAGESWRVTEEEWADAQARVPEMIPLLHTLNHPSLCSNPPSRFRRRVCPRSSATSRRSTGSAASECSPTARRWDSHRRGRTISSGETQGRTPCTPTPCTFH